MDRPRSHSKEDWEVEMTSPLSERPYHTRASSSLLQRSLLVSAPFVLSVAVFLCLFGLFLETAQGQSAQGSVESSGTVAEGALSAHILEANNQYLSGAYGDALNGYRSVLRAGYSSFGLYFNIGNASYRLGEKADALASYRLAEAERPRNPEVKGNIDLLLTEAGAEPRVARQGWFDYVPWSHWAGSDELFLLLCVCAGLAFTVFAVGHLLDPSTAAQTGQQSFRFFVNLAASSLLLVSLASAVAFLAVRERNQPGGRAVVKLANVNVRSEASDQSVALFELPHLSEVRVVNRYPSGSEHAGPGAEWYQVRYDGSLQGWLPAEALVVY
jgi:tetratricopeptide (TPR) repeat protein